MKIPYQQKYFSGVILLVVCSVPAVSMAGDAPHRGELNSISVPLADLDLTHDAGIKKLYARLKAAARRSCGTVDTREIRLFRLNKQCVRKALAKAVESIGNEKLSRLHAS